jgi:hypothetical protein
MNSFVKKAIFLKDFGEFYLELTNENLSGEHGIWNVASWSGCTSTDGIHKRGRRNFVKD